MSEHTLGPWAPTAGREVSNNGRFVVDKRGRLIADTRPRLAFETPEKDESNANARLIAKAPAMYDLLRHAIDAFGPAIEADEDINGADTVDWICMFVQAAKNCLEPTTKAKKK